MLIAVKDLSHGIRIKLN